MSASQQEALIVLAALRHLMLKTVGGMTGDTLGASIELVELAVLLGAAQLPAYILLPPVMFRYGSTYRRNVSSSMVISTSSNILRTVTT